MGEEAVILKYMLMETRRCPQFGENRPFLVYFSLGVIKIKGID